jgi:uncharacterized protein (DUF433 family)
MMERADRWLGIGLYTASEAAQLLNLPVAKVCRWLGGYRVAGHEYAPVWEPQLPKLDNQLGLGFLDLMQLKVAAQIVLQTDISLQAMRRALLLIRNLKLIEHGHPLVTSSFKTDGRRIFLEIGHETGEPQLYDIFGSQYAFHRVIAPTFKDVDLDFEITRWWPLGHDRTVVVDPQRSFGAPIASQSGISTATLALAAEREGSVRAVTRWYRVTEREVRDAVAFEQRLTRAPEPQMAA